MFNLLLEAQKAQQQFDRCSSKIDVIHNKFQEKGVDISYKGKWSFKVPLQNGFTLSLSVPPPELENEKQNPIRAETILYKDNVGLWYNGMEKYNYLGYQDPKEFIDEDGGAASEKNINDLLKELESLRGKLPLSD